MRNPHPLTIRSGIIATLLAGAALSAATLVMADTAPRSATASPDVYKVLAEDKGMRVILATGSLVSVTSGTHIRLWRCIGSPAAMHVFIRPTEPLWM
jgi:hypothetical protein